MDSSTTRKLGLVVEYDGTRYCGFQLQANGPTIQGELETAVARLTGDPARVQGASRTDSGAHAVGQVAAFSTESALPVSTFASGLNAYLPWDIAVREAHQMDPSFEPRRDATSRVYRYTIINRRARSPVWERWAHHVPGPLDIEAISVALRSLEGTHDFAPFGGRVPVGKRTIRRMMATRVWQEEDRLLVEMKANAFLPGQVRRTVGALLQVGTGRISPEAIRAMVDGQSNQLATEAVPAKGLCLMRVNYKDFPPDDCETNENL